LTGTVLDQLILCTPQTIWHVHDHPATEADSSHVHHDHDSHTHQHTSSTTVTIDSNEVRTLTDSMISSLRANPEKDITSILIRYKNKKNMQSLNLLRNINQNTGLMASSPAWEINRLYAMMGSGAEAIRYMAILIAFVAALSIFISLFTSLSERKYEIALMRVSGASPGKIFLLLISEALWISLFGLLLGLLLGHVGMSFAGSILQKGYKYAFTGQIWLREELYIIIGAILIGILAAIIPAIRGSRVRLHQTLAEN
jgi:putative ABC transport system permease protein